MHNIMNFFLILQIPVLLCMVFLQQLFLMNQLSIYFGLLAGLAVIVASIRSYWHGNRKALYVFWGFLILFLVPIIYIFPMPGYLHFRNNEADVNYFGEALRSLIFAVGIADRFYGLKKEVVKAQIEKQKMFYENEKRISEDRERIARELHDNIGSQLTLIALRINKLRGDHGEESEQHKVYNQTNIVISQLRDTIWTMDRKVITVGDLANRIRSQLWNLRIDPVKADVTLPEELSEIQIPHFIAIGIHRIVQESTQNALKHSKCTILSISFGWQNPMSIQLNIHDNGQGFQTTDVLTEEKYGIRNMKKRAQDMGSTLNITSSPGTGTLLSLAVSLSNQSSENDVQRKSLA